MAPSRQPDILLRGLLGQAGWSGQDLARAVNQAGAECGLNLHYERSSVAHWLSGTRPRAPVPALIAEVFTRHLGRPVTYPAPARTSTSARAFGPAPPVGHDQLDEAATDGGEADAVARLQTLHACRRQLLRNGVYRLAPPWAPPSFWAPAGLRPRGRDAVHLGREHVEAAEAMGRLFSDADATFGGGHSSAALAAYLALDIAPKLRRAATHVLRHNLLEAATRLTYLCAFMHLDQEQHPAAQMYYNTALQLAAETGNRTARATILGALSFQAHTLGHHAQAADLADTALSTAPGSIQSGTRAFLHGQAAVAAAGAQDHRTALHHLRAAATHLDRGDDTDPPAGTYYQAWLAYQQAVVFTALGDTSAAVTALARAVRQCPARERRSRAITLAALTRLHLRHGHLHPAISTWKLFAADYPRLSSQRVTTALTTLKRDLRPYQHHPAAAALLQPPA